MTSPRVEWLPPTTPPAPPPAPSRPQRTGWRRALGPLFVAGVLALKYGKAALLLLPKAKVLTTSASMLVSIAAYALIWGWRFAVGFVLLLFVHEMGHVVQLRREGIKASAPMFIPFLGALVAMKQMPKDAAAEARVGLAGPVLGVAGCIAVAVAAFAADSDLLRALAFTGFFLNLFNLVPVAFLDGGRAFAAMAPWMWFVGLGLAAALAFASPNPIILLLVVLGAFSTFGRWKQYRSGDPEVRRYFTVRPAVRWAVAGTYLALLVVCVLGMDATFIERTLDQA